MLRARRGNLLQVFCVGVAFFFLLGNGNRDITPIFHDVSQRFQARFQSRHPHGRRPHVDAAARLPQVQWNTDDTNSLRNNARGRRSRRAHALKEYPTYATDADNLPCSAAKVYGYSRYSMRGKGIVSRTCSSAQIQATTRSIPIPKPECGTLPYFRKSKYHLNASSGKPCS